MDSHLIQNVLNCLSSAISHRGTDFRTVLIMSPSTAVDKLRAASSHLYLEERLQVDEDILCPEVH